MAYSSDVKYSDSVDLKSQVEQKKREKQFGTFTGVFTPTLLTILGVIMFLRQGWVVGNAGLLGAWLIIFMSFLITICTALCLSSIITNIRVGAGGAFSVISQSLGLEVGGSIGIPLYLCQALAVAMYIFGFRSGWQWIFPEHSALLIDLTLFALLFLIAYVSASIAFKIQYLILGVIGVALVSIGAAAVQGSMQYPIQWWGEFPGAAETDFSGISLWAVFAVFFPASTGIMAGANMSGELSEPRKSIPIGTLSAIGVSLLVYLILSYWLARSATPSELVENYTIMIDRAAWGAAVIVGLLGATFSSALSSLVGSPRILQALGEHNILPKGSWIGRRADNGEPRHALYLTGAIVLSALMLRNLNTIAPLITMFFLLTYTMINVVVLIEQQLNLVSFRPTFRIPIIIPLIGTIGCLFVMFIINPVFSLVSIAVVLAIHAALMKRSLTAPFGDMRSGIFVAMAEWAVKKVDQLNASSERIWKANLLFPVERASQADQHYEFVRDLCYPKGLIKIVGLTLDENEEHLSDALQNFVARAKEDDLFASRSMITVADFSKNLVAGIETFGGTFFKPNLVLLGMPEKEDREQQVREVIETCHENRIGVLLLADPVNPGKRRKKAINVWLNGRENLWNIEHDLHRDDLTFLASYKLKLNWDANLQLITEVGNETEREQAKDYLTLVSELGRLRNCRKTVIPRGQYEMAPKADLNVFSLPDSVDFGELRMIAEVISTPCIFAMDSGNENALS